MRIGNSSMKGFLYSINNCVNVIRGTTVTLQASCLRSDPPHLPPSSPWPWHSSLPWLSWRHSLDEQGWIDHFQGFWAPKVFLEDVSWGHQVPKCMYQLLLMCAGCSGVGHPGSLGLKDLSVIWPSWKVSLLWNGKYPQAEPWLPGQQWRDNLILVKKPLLGFGFVCLFNTPSPAPLWTQPPMCFTGCEDEVGGGMFHQKPQAGSAGPNYHELVGPASLWGLSVGVQTARPPAPCSLWVCWLRWWLNSRWQAQSDTVPVIGYLSLNLGLAEPSLVLVMILPALNHLMLWVELCPPKKMLMWPYLEVRSWRMINLRCGYEGGS
jgi:hypothetical protein